MSATETAAASAELATTEPGAQRGAPVPVDNGVLHPDRWTMLGRIANTMKGTKFVPAAIRNDTSELMACLLFGDSLGLHPSVSLTQVYVVDGRPSLSAALMCGLVRAKGHRISRREIRDEGGDVLGVTCIGERPETGEADEFTFTLKMAERAGLLSKDNWKKYPEAMLWARACSQVCRMLFSDVFLGQAVYVPDEIEEEQRLRNGGAATGAAAGPEYGEDEELAERLVAHFDALEYLPAKRTLRLEGLDAEGRAALLAELEAEAAERQVEVAAPGAAEVVSETDEAAEAGDGEDDQVAFTPEAQAQIDRIWRESGEQPKEQLKID